MAAPQIVNLPEFFELADGMVVKITAISATDGSTVSGVTVSGVSIDVDPNTGTDDGGAPETFSDPGSPFYFGDVAA